MCNYQGYEFGASYPDSVCIDGRLWDADNCDIDGALYEPNDNIPCPVCHPLQYISHRQYYWSDGSFVHGIVCWFYAVRLTLNILKNRLFKTEPWRRK